MAVVITGSGIDTPAGGLDAADLTGTLPALDGSALTGIDTLPPTDFGAVGTYVIAARSPSGAIITDGTTTAGSNLDATGYYGVEATGNVTRTVGFSSTSLVGTWRAMGYADATISATSYPITLFVRIS